MMSDLSVQNLGQKKDWIVTSRAFHRLLSWLDDGANSDGGKYLEMRRRLVAYFDYKNCPVPDELADETLNRVARRLEEEDVIDCDTPARYCYIVARFVFMEHLRGMRKGNALLEDIGRQPYHDNAAAVEVEDERKVKEKLLICLEQCTSKLDPLKREIITRYYVGKERAKIENRRALAASLGITVNALSIRACRIRDTLENCVRQCAASD